MANTYGILFDLDGTLVNNEHVKAIAFSRAIEILGGKSNPTIYEKVMGMSGPVIRNQFIVESKVQIESDEYFELYKSIYENLLQTELEIKPGVVRFLSDLKSAGLKLAVASSAYKDVVNWIIETLDLAQYMDTVITGDDVINKKPSPDCFLLALERINIPQEQIIVFEDTEVGLKAAQNAGLMSLGIRHSYNQSHDFSYAVNEYSSFEEDIDLIKRDINKMFDSAIL
jgi:HAD superfamily hydrolase (TIGR01509 family)